MKNITIKNNSKTLEVEIWINEDTIAGYTSLEYNITENNIEVTNINDDVYEFLNDMEKYETYQNGETITIMSC